MEQEAPTWRKWYSDAEPEITDLPKSVKDVSLFHRILLLRALRPDRMLNALKQFVKENMGEDFVEQPAFDMTQTYDEMNVLTPVFFVLFPGVDPTPDVEKIGADHGKSISDKTFINISMGQGQEEYAIQTLKEAGKKEPKPCAPQMMMTMLPLMHSTPIRRRLLHHRVVCLWL